MCGIVLIANTVLRATGYPDFTCRIAPVPAAGSLHPIPLGAAALYECLCAKSPGHFDPFYDPTKKITSLPTAIHHKDELFASLFDISSINSICHHFDKFVAPMCIVPIVLHGAAGTSVGSRIKGHTKRGGRKITHQHRQHCVVGVTNENRTSRICSACYRQIFLLTEKRVKDGSIKTVRLHGAVQCQYKDCPRYKAGRPTQERDANSAINIATAGANSLLSVNNTVLPPFRPFSLPSPPPTTPEPPLERINPLPPHQGAPVGLVSSI
jgi:hypothetical protein